jgi:outer membrane protein assembly factor BamA
MTAHAGLLLTILLFMSTVSPRSGESASSCDTPLDRRPFGDHELVSRIEEGETREDSTDAEEGFIAKAVRSFEHNRWVERFRSGYRNFLPAFGGMSTGSGIALGVRYSDASLLGKGGGSWTTTWSTKGYQQYDAELRAQPSGRIPLSISVISRYRNFGQEDFYGSGSHSNEKDETNYRLEDFMGEARASVTPLPSIEVTLATGYLQSRTAPGTADDVPSLEEVFTEEKEPTGFAETLEYMTTGMGITVDFRDSPGYLRKGIKLFMGHMLFHGQGGDRYDFQETSAEFQSYLPFPSADKVVALRAALVDTRGRNGGSVPFHLLPYAGGSESIRGYREYRYRDSKILLANLEYRLEVTRSLEAAAFIDVGQVGGSWNEFHISGFRNSVGGGVRLHTEESVFLRIDLGHGREGTRIFFKTGSVFK